MIEVELPDGTIAELPDGLSDQQIEKALQQYSVQTEAAKRVKDMSLLRKATFGMERALDEPAMGLKQIVPKFLGGGLNEQEQRELAIRRSMEKQIPGAWSGRLVGDLAVGGGAASRVASGVRSAFPKATSLLAGLTGSAAGGAAVSAMNPTLEGESRTENAQQGAMFGALGEAGGRIIGRGIEGVVKLSDAAKRLPQKVRDAATLGQIADRTTGAGRVTAAIEERATSLPLIGSSIKNARERGTDAWREDVLERASPDGFIAPAAPGKSFRDRVGETYGEFTSRYAKALSGHRLTPSQQFEQMVLKMTTDPQRGIPDDAMEQIRKQVINNYKSRFGGAAQQAPAGTGVVTQGGQRGTAMEMTGENAKDFESFLSDMSRQYSRSQNPSHPNIGKLYSDLERAWEAAYKRQLGSGYRKEIAPLDQKYAPYKTVERAAASLGNEGGAFTPSQLTNSVAARTGRERFGRGAGALADQAEAGKSVFVDRLPNSGTGDRVMTGSALAAMAVDPITTGTLGTALGAGSTLLTTKAGKNLMTGDTRLQKLLQQMKLQKAARELGLPGGVASEQFMFDDSTEY